MINNLTKEIKEQIKRHSISESPNECCGLIIDRQGDIEILKCKNEARLKEENFEISVLDYLKASRRGDIISYYHSHTKNNVHFSMADKKVSTSHDLPLIMYSTSEDKFSEYSPV